MTNLTVAILISVNTNWCHIGTFTDLNGVPFKVEQGVIATNTEAKIEWEGQCKTVLLKSDPGPIVGERKTQSGTAYGTIQTFPLWKY